MTPQEQLELARRILRQESESISAVATAISKDFLAVADMIVGCKGLTFTTGVGTSGEVAARFAHILNCCGARSMFLHPSDSLHGHSGAIGPDDIVIAFSRNGSSNEVNECIRIAKSRGVSTACIVDAVQSELAQLCDAVLPIHTNKQYELLGYIATTSSLVHSAISDAICAVVREKLGYSLEDFKKTHPEGGVGKQLYEKE